jgi:DNA-directed RNA polymerase subunit E'
MYKLVTISDIVKVSPSKFNLPKEQAIKASLEEKWEGVIDRQLGVILAITKVGNVGEGSIFPGNGSIHYPIDFEALVYTPEQHEIVKGFVIDVTEFGVFVRIGPLDGMIHVSQIMDDYVSYDEKNNQFVGRDTKWVIKEGDEVLARIISISLGKEYKIGLTTRQPGLGCLHWKAKKVVKKEGKKRKK